MTETVYTDSIIVDTLCQATKDYLDENCTNGSYDLDDALQFIATYGEENLVKFYDDYIIYAEKLGSAGYEILDAFIALMGFHDIDKAEVMYRGEYSSEAVFAEDYYDQLGVVIPVEIVVDWDATWFSNLRHDYSEDNGYYFNTNIW